MNGLQLNNENNISINLMDVFKNNVKTFYTNNPSLTKRRPYTKGVISKTYIKNLKANIKNNLPNLPIPPEFQVVNDKLYTQTAFNKKFLTKKLKKLNTIYKKEIRKKENSNMSKVLQGYSMLINQVLNDEISEMTIDLTRVNNDFNIVAKLLENIKDQKVLIKAGNTYYTYNDKSRDIFRQFMSGTQFKDIKYSSKSDEELEDIIINYSNITISKVSDIKKGKYYENPNGSFFKYYHKLKDINLDKYQIYDEENSILDYKDNCFIHALIQHKLDDKIISYCKTKIRLRHLAMKDIKIIANDCKLYIEVSRDNSNVSKKYGDIKFKNTPSHIKLGLVDNHYFINDICNLTEWSINNYDIIKDKKDWNRRRKLDEFGNFTTSFRLVKLLIENKDNLLKRIPASDLYKTQFYDTIIDLTSLEYDEDVSLRCNNLVYDKEFGLDRNTKNKPTQQPEQIIFFDCETNTKKFNENNKKIQHVPYLVRCKPRGFDNVVFFGSDCLKYMMDYLKNKFPDNTLVLLAHNCGYDYRFLRKVLYRHELIENGHFLIMAKGSVYSGFGDNKKEHKIIIKDTYRMISIKLQKFGKMFNLPQEKDLMFYDLYTTDNINKRYINLQDCLKFAKNNNEEQLFISNCKKWNILNNDKVDILEYSSRYCEIDIDVMESGYESFRKSIKQISKELVNNKNDIELDIDNFYTISAVATSLLMLDKCFKNTYKLAGVPRAFLQKFVVGGRTMLCDNKKQFIKKRKITDKNHRHFGKTVYIQDFDSVSEYPSSMYRIQGFIKGTPKVIKNLNKKWLAKQDNYFIEIKLNSVGIKRKFPLISKVNKDGIRNFTNALEGEILYADKTMIEDWDEFQKIDYDVIRGYYFNEGFNNNVNGTIHQLFNQRLKYKSLGNPIQEVYKLIMNSSYGRTLMKPHETKTEYIPSNKFDSYQNRHYNSIKSFIYDEDNKNVRVDKYGEIDNHFNDVHQGVSILSMSKRIMNEVMCLAEDKDLDMYYTDTDSIHMCSHDVPLLSDYFKQKYNRELIGKNMGQFHNDFDLNNCRDVSSELFVGLGKKCYIDKLSGISNDTNKKEYGSHIRLKGVSTNSIKGYGKLNNICLFKLYEKMYKGHSIKFDLCIDELGDAKLCFKFNKDFTITNFNDDKKGFKREVKF